MYTILNHLFNPDFIYGVIASIAAYVIIWGILKFWKNIIFPQFQKATYNDRVVTGEWSNSLTIGKTAERVTAKMSLSQNAWKITGKLSITSTNNKAKADHFECDLTGEKKGEYIILTGLPSKNETLTLNCGIFKLSNKNDKLLGSAIRLNKHTSEIEVDEEIIWEKI